MSDYVTLSVDGETPELPEPLTLSEGFHVSIETDDSDAYNHTCQYCDARVNSDGTDDGGETRCDGRCADCGRPLDDYADSGNPDGEECDGMHCCADGCPNAVDECDGMECNGITPGSGVHVPGGPPALAWLNSAGIEVNPGHDSVTVTVSVGDPRGAFAFTVRQVTPDEGDPYLMMHTPYPGESLPHMPLAYASEGTYRVQSYGGTAVPDPRTADDTVTLSLMQQGALGALRALVNAQLRSGPTEAVRAMTEAARLLGLLPQ